MSPEGDTGSEPNHGATSASPPAGDRLWALLGASPSSGAREGHREG